MCSVLEFSSESDKLRTLFSESNRFDSVLFIFDGGRRYKVSSSSLGIHSPQDLLLPLGLGLFRKAVLFGLITFIPKVVISIKVLTVFVARSSDTRVPACQSRAVIFFPTAPVAGCISFIGATTNTVWNAVV